MTIFYSKFESLFETLRCTPSKCQSLKSPWWSAVLLPLWVHLLLLCSLLTLLHPQVHFLHVPGTWLACFHLSPLLAIPMVWYRHIFLSFFLQIFALRSPYQRGIPDHIFQLSIAAYQITPKQWLQATFYIIAYNFVGGEFGQGLAGSLYWNWYR